MYFLQIVSEKKIFSKKLKVFYLILLFIFLSSKSIFSNNLKIVSVGGSITEIIYALNEQDKIIARDSTSTYPNEAIKKPSVGYMRALSSEGVLSIEPNLVIAIQGSGPKETIDILTQSSIKFVTIPNVYSKEGIVNKIIAVGKALNNEEKARILSNEVMEKLKIAEKIIENNTVSPKRVLFILSTRGGKVLAAGKNTAASAIIEMSGGINPINSFEGYKILSDEAIISAAPEAIIMMSRGGEHSIENEKLFSIPSLKNTPAAKNIEVIRMDGLYMLGFGPRTASAIKELNFNLYGKNVDNY